MDAHLWLPCAPDIHIHTAHIHACGQNTHTCIHVNIQQILKLFKIIGLSYNGAANTILRTFSPLIHLFFYWAFISMKPQLRRSSYQNCQIGLY